MTTLNSFTSNGDVLESLSLFNTLVYSILSQFNNEHENLINRTQRNNFAKIEALVNASIEEDVNMSCIICLEENGGLCKSLCNHYAHKSCWKSWFAEKYTCPMCRNTEPFGNPESSDNNHQM